MNPDRSWPRSSQGRPFTVIRSTPTLLEAQLGQAGVIYRLEARLEPAPGGARPSWTLHVSRPSPDEPEYTSIVVYFDRCHSAQEAVERALQKLQEIQRQCPCCGYLTLPERGMMHVCPVCCWVDEDDYQVYAAEWFQVSWDLFQARAHYVDFGTARQQCRGQVRPPLAEEISSDHVERVTIYRDDRRWEGTMSYRGLTYEVTIEHRGSVGEEIRFFTSDPFPNCPPGTLVARGHLVPKEVGQGVLRLPESNTIEEGIVYAEHMVRTWTRMGCGWR